MTGSFDPDAAAAPGSGLFGLPHSPEQAQVVLLPVPFEATCSYGGGTSLGPAAILAASRQVDLFDLETGRPYLQGIALLEEPAEVRGWNEEAKGLARPILQAGGGGELGALAEVDRLCERMNAWVHRTARHWLERGKQVGAVGGDHSISFGCIRAHAEAHPGLGILHLDAHADLRQAFEGFRWSHASIMFNVLERIPEVGKLVQVGIRDLGESEQRYLEASGGRAVAFSDPWLCSRRFEGVSWNRLVEEMVSALPGEVYLSVDIDGLDPTLCPHTGTPVPGGLSFAELSALLGGVVRSGRRIVGMDLVEVAPDLSGGQWDGNVGARVLYKMIGWMLRSQPGGPAL